MQQMRVRADRQVTSLLDFTFWSDLVVILVIVGVNIVNILRANGGQGALVTAAEPELVLIVSFALVLYLGYGCVQALSIKSRMNRVFVSLDETGVSGLSLPNPTTGVPGEEFSISYDKITSVSVEEIAITKKHVAPSLKLEADEQSYHVPAPEHLKEIVQQIAERMTAK
jgi:hypothetical protein